jgi:hypothetical protein
MHAHWQEVFDIDKLTFVYPEEFVRLEDEKGESLSIYANVDRLEAELLQRATAAFTAAPICGQQRARCWWLSGRSEDRTCWKIMVIWRSSAPNRSRGTSGTPRRNFAV